MNFQYVKRLLKRVANFKKTGFVVKSCFLYTKQHSVSWILAQKPFDKSECRIFFNYNISWTNGVKRAWSLILYVIRYPSKQQIYLVISSWHAQRSETIGYPIYLFWEKLGAVHTLLRKMQNQLISSVSKSSSSERILKIYRKTLAMASYFSKVGLLLY